MMTFSSDKMKAITGHFVIIYGQTIHDLYSQNQCKIERKVTESFRMENYRISGNKRFPMLCLHLDKIPSALNTKHPQIPEHKYIIPACRMPKFYNLQYWQGVWRTNKSFQHTATICNIHKVSGVQIHHSNILHAIMRIFVCKPN